MQNKVKCDTSTQFRLILQIYSLCWLIHSNVGASSISRNYVLTRFLLRPTRREFLYGNRKTTNNTKGHESSIRVFRVLSCCSWFLLPVPVEPDSFVKTRVRQGILVEPERIQTGLCTTTPRTRTRISLGNKKAPPKRLFPRLKGRAGPSENRHPGHPCPSSPKRGSQKPSSHRKRACPEPARGFLGSG